MKTLSEGQIIDGKILRYAKAWSWYAIARRLACDVRALREAIDPNYSEYAEKRLARRNIARRARTAADALERANLPKVKRKPTTIRETDIQSLANKRAVRSDLAFIAAMTRSIRRGDEAAPEGTRKTPSTDNPHFVPHRSPGLLSVTGSSSQMCADFA